VLGASLSAKVSKTRQGFDRKCDANKLSISLRKKEASVESFQLPEGTDGSGFGKVQTEGRAASARGEANLCVG